MNQVRDPNFLKIVALLWRAQNHKMLSLQRPKFARKAHFSKFWGLLLPILSYRVVVQKILPLMKTSENSKNSVFDLSTLTFSKI